MFKPEAFGGRRLFDFKPSTATFANAVPPERALAFAAILLNSLSARHPGGELSANDQTALELVAYLCIRLQEMDTVPRQVSHGRSQPHARSNASRIAQSF
jgi:hypothetical protein